MRVITDPAGVSRALLVNVLRKDAYTGSTRALDIDSGKVLWEGERSVYNVEFEPDGDVAWLGGPVNTDALYNYDTDGALRAVRLATGEVLAQYPSRFTATQFLRTDDRLYAVDYPPGGIGFHSYIAGAGPSFELRAFDLTTRGLIWSASPEGAGGEHWELYNSVRLSMVGGLLLLEGETSFHGCSAELIDPTTGRTMARRVVHPN